MITRKTAPAHNTSEDPRFLASLAADFQFSKLNERSELRQNCLYKLECKAYHWKKDVFVTTKAVAHNYSNRGLYLETNHLFESGLPVFISSGNSGTDPFESELAKGVHAQIVWCKTIHNRPEPFYGVGLRFFERFREISRMPLKL